MSCSKHDVDCARRLSLNTAGIASIMTSMPLFGERSPNVRMTGRPANPKFRFGCLGRDDTARRVSHAG